MTILSIFSRIAIARIPCVYRHFSRLYGNMAILFTKKYFMRAKA